MNYLVNIELPINKFDKSKSLGRRNGTEPMDNQWNGLFRSYMRDNALCIVTANFDVKSHKTCSVTNR